MRTAVEKFIEQLEDQGDSWENVSIGRIQISIKVEDYLKLKEQAKEMEKEQMIDFVDNLIVGMSREKIEQYYKETYESKNKN